MAAAAAPNAGRSPTIERDYGRVTVRADVGVTEPALCDRGCAAAVPRAGSAAFARLASELMAHLRAAVVVPGKPVELVTDWLCASFVVAAIDEKSGFEQALGMAFQGAAAGAVFKGTGVSYAWDSISNAVVHGTVDGESLILIAADDVDATASTVSIDSRALAATMDMPVIEPCSVGHIPRVVSLAGAMSVAAGEPVMVRYTPMLGQMPAVLVDDRLAAPSYANGVPGPSASGASIASGVGGRRRAHGMTKAGRHVHRDHISRPLFRDMVESAGLTVERGGQGRTALIGFGAIWSATGLDVADHFGWPTMGSSVILPLPQAVVDFAARHDTVVVLEEGAAVAETALTLALLDTSAATVVLGRRSGLISRVGTPTSGELIDVLSGQPSSSGPGLWKDPTGKQADPPYDTLFETVRTLRHRHDLTVTTCVGTVIDAAGPPWNSADLALSLGSATGTAAGVARAGGTAVALIGDFGLLHSGLNAFEAIQRGALPVLTIVVANGVSRRTGNQRTPCHPDEPNALDLIGEMRARGASRLVVLDGDEIGVAGLVDRVEHHLGNLPATLVLLSGEGIFRASCADSCHARGPG
jgi:indolepyruvate ferredoxin oxidoreductase alpha subunit